MLGFYSLFPGTMPAFLKEKVGTSDTQVIRSMERTKEVALLRLGITGIISQENKSHFFNMEIPGTERARFIQYTFDAKLGFEGKDVSIKETGKNTFDVEIPEFKFIGYDHPEYRMIVEQNGALSFGTQQIDSLDMINNILTEKTKQEYVDSNRDLLEEQAKSFYASIVMGVNPEAKLISHSKPQRVREIALNLHFEQYGFAPGIGSALRKTDNIFSVCLFLPLARRQEYEQACKSKSRTGIDLCFSMLCFP